MFSNHTVKSGETLYSIAMAYNIAPCLLLRLNKLRRASDIKAGMVLTVPNNAPMNADEIMDGTEAGAECVDSACEAAVIERGDWSQVPAMPAGEYAIGDDMKLERYIVKPGDTVYKIAEKFNTTTSNIIIANGLRPPYMIFPGRELIVPYTGKETVIYTVRKGDTVYGIAMKYGVPIGNIIDYNYLDKAATIYPNQQLIVRTR